MQQHNGVPIEEPGDQWRMAYPQYVTPPPRRKKRWPWVVGLLVILLLACGGLSIAMLGAGAKAINDEIEGQRSDVTLVAGSCKSDGQGMFKAKVKITNSGKSARSYWVQVNLDKGTTRLGEAHAIVNNLGPGQTATEEATGNGTFSKGAACTVGDVK